MPQSVTSPHIHIVFSTRGREPWILPDLAPRPYEYFGGILRDRGCCLVAAGGMPDHVHLLVTFPGTLTFADLMRDVKGGSSRFVTETLTPGAWAPGRCRALSIARPRARGGRSPRTCPRRP